MSKDRQLTEQELIEAYLSHCPAGDRRWLKRAYFAPATQGASRKPRALSLPRSWGRKSLWKAIGDEQPLCAREFLGKRGSRTLYRPEAIERLGYIIEGLKIGLSPEQIHRALESGIERLMLPMCRDVSNIRYVLTRPLVLLLNLRGPAERLRQQQGALRRRFGRIEVSSRRATERIVIDVYRISPEGLGDRKIDPSKLRAMLDRVFPASLVGKPGVPEDLHQSLERQVRELAHRSVKPASGAPDEVRAIAARGLAHLQRTQREMEKLLLIDPTKLIDPHIYERLWRWKQRTDEVVAVLGKENPSTPRRAVEDRLESDRRARNAIPLSYYLHLPNEAEYFGGLASTRKTISAMKRIASSPDAATGADWETVERHVVPEYTVRLVAAAENPVVYSVTIKEPNRPMSLLEHACSHLSVIKAEFADWVRVCELCQRFFAVHDPDQGNRCPRCKR